MEYKKKVNRINAVSISTGDYGILRYDSGVQFGRLLHSGVFLVGRNPIQLKISETLSNTVGIDREPRFILILWTIYRWPVRTEYAIGPVLLIGLSKSFQVHLIKIPSYRIYSICHLYIFLSVALNTIDGEWGS